MDSADQKIPFLIWLQEDPLGEQLPSKSHSLFTRLKGIELKFHKWDQITKMGKHSISFLLYDIALLVEP